MSIEDQGIQHKTVGGGLIASIRGNVPDRQGIAEFIQMLKEVIPAEMILGPAVAVRYFMHSYPEGLDVEVGFPVREPVEAGGVSTRQFPQYEVLAKMSEGGLDALGEAYSAVFGCQNEYGLISDEFCFEVLHDDDPVNGRIEAQMVLHDWQGLFSQHLSRVVGEDVRDAVMADSDTIFLESSVDQRFEWVKAAVDRFDRLADDLQRYEVLSSCSHVYPPDQAAKLRPVYLEAIDKEPDMHKAVDAVLAFMDADHGWSPGQRVREGNQVMITKRPRDPQGVENATTDLERMQAACFCPLVRAHMGDGMSDTFCYCSAGFERKQWEAALGQPVRIEVVQSLLKGDLQCQFAVELPVEIVI